MIKYKYKYKVSSTKKYRFLELQILGPITLKLQKPTYMKPKCHRLCDLLSYNVCESNLMCRLLLQSRTLKFTYTEKYQNAANLDGSTIYFVTNVHLKERAL